MSNIQTSATAPGASSSKTKHVSGRDVFGATADQLSPTELRNAITGYELRYRIEAVVAGITEKKLKHIYQGDGAATGREVMILPAIPQTKLFATEHANIILGYTMHETCHQLHTDFSLLEKIFAGDQKPTKRDHQLKSFWNAIEDYRIEKVGRVRYPGFHKYISATRHHSAKRFVEQVDAGQVDGKTLSNAYAIGAVALTWVGAKLNKYPTPMSEEALRRLPDDLRQWTESWAPEMALVTTNDEAFALANKILDDLDQQRQQQDDGDEPDDQKNGSNQKNQQSDRSGDGQAQGQPDDSDDQDHGQNNGQANSSSSQDDKTGQDEDQSPSKNDKSKKSDSPEQDDGDQDNANGAENNDDSVSSNIADGKEDDKQPGAQNKEEPTDGDDASTDANSKNDDDQDSDDNQSPSAKNNDGDDSDDQASTAGNNEDKNDDKSTPGQDKSKSTGKDSSNSSNDDDNDSGDPAKGTGSGRPQVKVNDGDEQADARQADLEIDEISKELANKTSPIDHIMPDINETVGRSVVTEVERGQKRYTQIRSQIGPAASRAAGIMRRLLMARDVSRVRRELDEGSLDLGRLVPVANGSPNIYKRIATKSDVNTAVSILVDNSGSMNHQPIFVCQQASIVLDMAIQGTKADLEINGFTGGVHAPIIYRYRTFGQKGQASSASLGNMDNVPLGGTPVSQAMLDSWRRLHEHKAPRKILIIITDGDADDMARAKEVHDLIGAMGGLCVGIGIGNVSSLTRWCTNSVQVNNIEDLPIALSQIVQQAMTPLRRAA